MSYGLYVLNCDCGWSTASKAGNKNRVVPPTKCEACGKEGKAEFDDSDHAVAEWIMSQSDRIAEKLREHARKHGLLVLQVSKRRYMVLKEDVGNCTTFGDGKKVCYTSLKLLVGPVDYEEAMKYIRSHTDVLPEYLSN